MPNSIGKVLNMQELVVVHFLDDVSIYKKYPPPRGHSNLKSTAMTEANDRRFILNFFSPKIVVVNWRTESPRKLNCLGAQGILLDNDLTD